MCTSATKTKAVEPLRQTKILDYMKKIPASKFTTGKRKSLLTGEVSPVVKLTSELDRNAHDYSLNSADRQDCYEIVEPFLSVNGFGHWHNLRKRAKVDYTATKISGGEDGNKEVGKDLSDDNTNQQGRNNIAKYDRERHESGIKKRDEREKRGTLGRQTSGEFNMKGDVKRRQKERSEKIMCSHGSGKEDEDKDWNFKGKSKVRKLDSNVNNDSKQDNIQTDKQMCSDAGNQKLYSLEDKCQSCRYTGHIGDSVNTETEKTAACNTTETVQTLRNIEKPIYGRNDHIEAACAVSEELTDRSISCLNLKTVDIVEKEVEDGNKKIDNFFRVKKTAGSVQKVDVTPMKDYQTVEKHDPVIVDRVIDTDNSSNKLFNFYMTCPVPIPEIDFDITDYIDVYNFQIVKEKAFDVVQTAVNEKRASLEITRNKAQFVEKLTCMDTSANCYNESDADQIVQNHVDQLKASFDDLTGQGNGNKEAKYSTSNDSLKNLRFQSNKVEVNQKTDSGEGLCGSRMETLRDKLNIAVEDEASYVEDINDMYSVGPSESLLERDIIEQIQVTRSESGKCTGEHTGGSESTSKNPSTTDASPTEIMPLQASSVAEVSSVGLVDEKSHLLVGSVVWGRFSKNVWWPALVLEEKLVRKSNKDGFVWLYWFSDEQYSQVKECHVDPFYKKFLSRCRQTNNKKMKKGISLALQICACRAEVDVTKYGGIDGWVQADDGFLYKDRQLFQPKSDDAIPDYVFENLGFTPPSPCYQTSITNSDNTNEGQEPVSVGPEQGKQTCNTVCNSRKEVCSTTQDIGFNGDSDEGERCLACDTTWEVCNEHPLFVGKICRKCKEVLRSSFYAIDDDGCSMFCCICGEGGSLYVCDDILCGKAYCFICVARHSSPTTVKYVKDAKCWNCFLCTEYSTCTHGRLVPQEDWSLELVKFFQAGQVPLCDDLQYMKTNSKRKLRVLSMFDGIGTGKLVLDELGLDVEVYYASEIEPDAILVSRYHHAPVHLGDAWDLDRNKLETLCPIDLVLGGPPCNDLSIVNPARKGFNGTGILVLKFLSILKDIEALCRGKSHVFWLLENTGSMLTEYKEVICKMLGMEPAVWDAKHFTGQKRARNFWGNIPGMYSTAQYCRHLDRDKKDLDSALISNCNRKARVSHSRTITTSRNSLTVTNGFNDALVCMNGEEDHIWVQEVERLFGFPTHYTDVGYLTHERRRKLLGKSWSVPVIKHLLSPLKQYFKVKDKKEDVRNP